MFRFTIMLETEYHQFETTHGYFKLDPDNKTVLDLSEKYELSQVKWLYFTAISPKNPQHRAWFHAIRGPAFGEPHYHGKLLPCIITRTLLKENCSVMQCDDTSMIFAFKNYGNYLKRKQS